MKKTVFTLLFSFSFVAMMAQVKMPQPSPTQTLKQDFGLGTIEITYSRPVVKGRKIFGDLVPYNKLWRTGANAATQVRFTQPVEIMGKKVDTGTYALYSIPGNESWTIILNKGTKNWGIEGYSEADDVVRVNVEPMKLKTRIESFTIQVANVKAANCELHIMWDKTAVQVPVYANINDKIKTQLEAAMLTEKKPYWQAAQFYNEYEQNSTKALEYATKATEANPKAYWIWIYKAKIEKEMGDKNAALQSAQKSLELATQEKNDDYIKMNEELIRKLKK